VGNILNRLVFIIPILIPPVSNLTKIATFTGFKREPSPPKQSPNWHVAYGFKMKTLLKYLVKNIVNHPNKIAIDEKENKELTELYLEVDPKDLGKVIGKKGKTIKALRTLLYLKSLFKKRKIRLYLKESNSLK
jgi:predicted RNA-binding protein YlqC (UPF0109 family)